MGQVTVGSRKEARDLKYAGDEAAGCHSPAGVCWAYVTWRFVFFSPPPPEFRLGPPKEPVMSACR